jgi:hypothetical protein
MTMPREHKMETSLYLFKKEQQSLEWVTGHTVGRIKHGQQKHSQCIS